MLPPDILDKLTNSPIVLFLGQRYLNVESNHNVFLTEVLKKYGGGTSIDNPSYNDLLNLGLSKEIESAASWMDNLSKFVNAPNSIQTVASIPWSAVFTSSIDPVINYLFENDWRKVQIVCDERVRINEPRNKMNLHLTKVFGCLSRHLSAQRAPLTLPEKAKRQFTAASLLRKLPETVSSSGLLVIEGYDVNDWVDFDSIFYSTIVQLGESQTIFCSVSPALESNMLFRDLVDSKKVLAFKESFGQIIESLEAEGRYKISTPEFEERFAKYLTIEGKKIKIPKEIYQNISKSAIVIDNHLFDFEPSKSDDDKYAQFREFLATTNIKNLWSGFPKGFGFKRDYFENLKIAVFAKTKFNNSKSQPIVLHGQSGGGKTISLAFLAYELKKEQSIPILFIEKKYQKIDEHHIDLFCHWAEEQGARGTIIIWDGMVDIGLYYGLLGKLQARGRNVVVVGSAYPLKKPTNSSILSKAELGETELKRFRKFIESIDLVLKDIIPARETNILSMFYRYLPDSRVKIQQGLRSEFDYFKQLIREYSDQTNDYNNRPTMFDLMDQAGLIDKDIINDDDFDFDQEEEIDGERVTLADKLIYSVMVPGQFGIGIPFELFVKNLGFSTVSSTPFRLLGLINIIVWDEDNVGNITLGSRTAIEARILAGYLGNKRAQMEYIKSLLGSVSCEDFISEDGYYESSREIQFAVDLLYNVGPNAPNSNGEYKEFIYDIAEVLRKLRENNQAYHPRLILKEASFLREIVRNNWPKGTETKEDLLSRAEDMVRQALEDLEGYDDMVITAFLKVELASIMGSKTLESISEGNSDRAKEYYAAVRSISSPSFASNPDNYSALDVLAWTTLRLLKSNVFNEEERLEAEAALLNLFEISENEGVSSEHYDDFNERKMDLLQITKNEVLSQALFDRLVQEGSTTGYYIRTKSIIEASDDKSLSPAELALKYMRAYNYLSQFENKIQDDGRCLFLLFRSWWAMKNKSFPLADEKKTIPLTIDDWAYCLTLTDKILRCHGWEEIAVVLYIKALAEFHLDLMTDMTNTFRKLGLLTDFSSYGGRRVIRSYVASTTDGRPRLFSGDVRYNVSLVRKQKTGELYVNELKIYIPFPLYEFSQAAYSKGDTIKDFYIGFNFRGPIAVYNTFD